MEHTGNSWYPTLFFSCEWQQNTYVHFIYILEQLSLAAAPRKYVHSGLVLGLGWALRQLSSILYLPCLSLRTQYQVICPNDLYFTRSPSLNNWTAYHCYTSKQYGCVTSHVHRTYIYQIMLLYNPSCKLLLHTWADQLAPTTNVRNINR